MASKASRPSGTDRLGIAFALTAATGLGLAIAVSRLAYEGGTNGLTVATCRSVVMVAGLSVFCVLSGRRLRLPARDHVHCLGLGVLMAFMFYGNVGSVQFIPVGLAALLFYTYPPVVAVIQILVVRDPVPAPKLALIVLAFAGLAIMLSTSLVDSSPVGVALALGAGVCAAWNSVWVIRKLSHHDALVLTLHMACVAAVILICLSAGSGRLHPPHTSTGWLGLVLVVALQSLSIPLFFLALRRVGALQSAMVSNIQPVVSIAAAFVLYAEVLTPSQFLGGGMVLGAVWFMQRLDPRRRN